MAIEVPVTIMLMARDERSGVAMRTANGEAIDQKTACAAATMRRAATRSSNVGASAEATCPAQNTPSTPTMRVLGGTRLATSMSGSESTATAAA